MNQNNDRAVLPTCWCKSPLGGAGVIAMAGILLIGIASPSVYAITISMEYTDEGDTPPHDENPEWDPDGTILKAHFNAAKAIWESLLPGPGDFSFDFHWDDNLETDQLGQYTGGIDEFIEINP